MNWGKSLVLVMVFFMGYIGFLVSKAFRSDSELVAKDYYEQEVKYETQLNRMRSKFAKAMIYNFDNQNNKLVLNFGETPIESGKVLFYKASSAKQDVEKSLNQQSVQEISTQNLGTGLWKVKITWKQGGEECYREETLVK
ncbi:MAG: hypothetical protein RLZZ175_2919 [Bacteroidota bacterium]|jgi:nitrogen fixation protein FixH